MIRSLGSPSDLEDEDASGVVLDGRGRAPPTRPASSESATAPSTVKPRIQGSTYLESHQLGQPKIHGQDDTKTLTPRKQRSHMVGVPRYGVSCGTYTAHTVHEDDERHVYRIPRKRHGPTRG